jgi:nitric oxide reductase activation protein
MRIFRSPTERQRPNTAVHILVDMSSSMNNRVGPGQGDKKLSDVASESALALALALQPIPGVNPAVTYFMGGQIPVRSVVKHGENVMQQAGRFIYTPTSSTPMAEAIWYAAYELTKTREAKKVMVVLTDGEPNSHAPCKAVIDLCEQSDIEMYGIGIKTASVDSLFKRNIVINDVSDLQRTLFKLVGQSLINPAA